MKYIGINQRIPFAVIDSAIYQWLESGVVNKVSILNHIKEYTKGENRALKVVAYVSAIMNKQTKILTIISKKIDIGKWQQMPENERKVIALCLISLTYPICYDLLVAISAGLKTQSQISKKFISTRIAAQYGTNRSVDIALDALLPMIIEAGTIIRDRISIYSAAPKISIASSIVTELVIYTDISLSGLKSLLEVEIQFRPWSGYFRFTVTNNTNFQLLRFDDNGTGRGYLSLIV